jgi:tRNA 2-thiouridine synthesizing protein E
MEWPMASTRLAREDDMLHLGAGQEFNSTGYLVNFDAWDKDFAISLAQEHGLDLTDCHWLIINFLRDYYMEYGIAPEPRIIIKRLSNKITPDVPCTRRHLEGLFADGGCKLACKIAGLPNCHCSGV